MTKDSMNKVSLRPQVLVVRTQLQREAQLQSAAKSMDRTLRQLRFQGFDVRQIELKAIVLNSGGKHDGSV